MKKLALTLSAVCVMMISGALLCLNRQKAPPAPIAESPANQAAAPMPLEPVVVAEKPASKVMENENKPAPAPVATSVTNETRPAAAPDPIHQAVDGLLAEKNSGQKQALFDQLRKAGQLEAAIAELKQRAADNPKDPEIPTTLGEALINELRAVRESSGDYNEIAILAMQADQSFNAALKIDPKNWEAQFVKAASMYYWPANPQLDDDVVQRLSNLIDQQETMPADSDFAQTYVVLGNEFQKIGQPEKAQATWQLGLAKFPNDPTLQKIIIGH